MTLQRTDFDERFEEQCLDLIERYKDASGKALERHEFPGALAALQAIGSVAATLHATLVEREHQQRVHPPEDDTPDPDSPLGDPVADL